MPDLRGHGASPAGPDRRQWTVSAMVDELTALERRVLKWRDQGARPQDVAWRFRRSPEHIARVERLARYKLRQTAS